MNDQEFKKEIIEKLDTMIKLIAVSSRFEQILKGKKQKDQIKILSNLGLSRDIVALILGTTPETVRVTLAKIGSKAKSKKGRLQKKTGRKGK